MVCPLDWGLGHASRCVPLINQFLKEGHEVIIGADKKPLAFLKEEFPKLKTIVIPGLEINYGKRGGSFRLFCEAVKFYGYINKERLLLGEVLEKHDIDVVVSDNRYGLYSKKTKSVILTHQVFPKAPIAESLLHKKIERLLRSFDEVWIPDDKTNNNLSGDLSHLKTPKQRHSFIGPLSRFSLPTKTLNIEFDVCAIISGPEPQRTIFEKKLIEEINKYNLKSIFVRGLPGVSGSNIDTKTITIFNHLETKKLQEYILKSKLVVCRSGYSSIMDMDALNKKALLIPTPGQTEQEYLAFYHKKNKLFFVQEQSDINLKKVLDKL